MSESEISGKSHPPNIVECAVQPMRHSSLSSKVQAIAADVFDRMWTYARGAVEIMLHGMAIEYEVPGWERCRCCLGSAIDGFWSVRGKG